MVAIPEHPSLAFPEPVQPLGDSDQETLDPAGEGLPVIGLDEQVQVVGLDREVDQAKSETLTSCRKSTIQLFPRLLATQ